MHATPLITTLVAALVAAFVFGALATRLRLSPLVGYLLAGVLVGPATPGFVADLSLAAELAEIGVILLMFGVGLHFSFDDLLSVRRIAIPGALVQMAIATLLGVALAFSLGWSLGAGLVFGLALSVASTVVLLRALEERRLVETERGRIAVGWLIVEDLAMVLALVILPAVAGAVGGEGASGGQIALTLGITLAKVAAFVAVMLVVGRRAIPWVLDRVAGAGSRELFTLAVLAVALGIAFGSAALFGVSFALGAFFAGMVLAGSDLSHRAAEDSLPLRDAFAVLFFVSVGMLFDPAVLIERPLAVAGAFLIVVVGKSLAAYALVRRFRYSRRTALTIAASLGQIGEFSFILATLGVKLGLLSEAGQDVLLAAAILSILVNPAFFGLTDRWLARTAATVEPAAAKAEAPPATLLTDHLVLIGYGRVGHLVGEGLRENGRPFLVIEDQEEIVEQLRASGIETLTGNAAKIDVLEAANLSRAKWLFVAIPNAFEAGQIIEKALRLNPDVQIIARAHSDAEVEHLKAHGAPQVIMGEREIARGMLSHVLLEEAPSK